MELSGEAIRWARQRRGLTQDELAEEVGVSQQTVSKWESDKVDPRADRRERLREILDFEFARGDILRSGTTGEVVVVDGQFPTEDTGTTEAKEAGGGYTGAIGDEPRLTPAQASFRDELLDRLSEGHRSLTPEEIELWRQLGRLYGLELYGE